MLVQSEPGVEQEISEYFTFFVPGYRFMPSYKNKMWDGKIRLYNLRSKELYTGLLNHLLRFTKDREYEVEYKSFPRILNGLGVSIVSTSKGLMTGKKAEHMNLGGELRCYIY